MNKWEFRQKMEGMTDEELFQRIKQAYTYKMPSLRLVPYVGNKKEIVTYDYPELIARCPVTGILDTYRIIIDFIPNKYIPELKTLKFYFMAFDPLPISHEHLASKIYKEFKEQVKPQKLYIRLFTSVRGGIYTTVSLGDKEIESDSKLRHVSGY